MKLTRLSNPLVLLVLLFSFPVIANCQNWNTSQDYDHNYTVQFPEVPQEVFKNVPEGLKITTFAQSAACTYMTKILVLKSEAKDPTAMAKKTLNTLATKLGGNVVNEEEWSLGNSIGTKGVIDVPDKGEGKPQMKVLCNVIVNGGVQYQLIAMGPTEFFQDGVANHFLGSFRFLK